MAKLYKNQKVLTIIYVHKSNKITIKTKPFRCFYINFIVFGHVELFRWWGEYKSIMSDLNDDVLYDP